MIFTYLVLFFAKVFDNALGTSKTILIQRNRWLLSGIIPKYAGCVNGVEWFRSHGQWLDGSATPETGMIIFYD